MLFPFKALFFDVFSSCKTCFFGVLFPFKALFSTCCSLLRHFFLTCFSPLRHFFSTCCSPSRQFFFRSVIPLEAFFFYACFSPSKHFFLSCCSSSGCLCFFIFRSSYRDLIPPHLATSYGPAGLMVLLKSAFFWKLSRSTQYIHVRDYTDIFVFM